MTSQTSTILKSAFEQGDRPQGSDFVDLIDSFVNLVDTTAQTVTSNITIPNINTGRLIASATVETSRVVASNKISWGSVAGCELTSSGTANVATLTLLNASIIEYTSAETSAFFGDAGVTDMGAVKFARIIVNGSAYAIPLFKGSLVP